MLHDLFIDVWHDLFLILHCNELDDMLLKLVPNSLYYRLSVATSHCPPPRTSCQRLANPWVVALNIFLGLEGLSSGRRELCANRGA